MSWNEIGTMLTTEQVNAIRDALIVRKDEIFDQIDALGEEAGRIDAILQIMDEERYDYVKNCILKENHDQV